MSNMNINMSVPAKTALIASSILCGKKYQEIADYLGCTTANVTQHKGAAVKLGLISDEDAKKVFAAPGRPTGEEE